jgi:hypothetical protein
MWRKYLTESIFCVMIVHSFELSRKQEPLQPLLPAALVTLPELERMLLGVQLDMIHLLQHFQVDLENRHASKKSI